MKNPYTALLRVARALLLLVLPELAHAQAPTVAVTPAGPRTVCAGSSQTLTATATASGFNIAGSGFDGPVYALALQPDGKVLVGGDFGAYNGNASAPDNLLRLNADGSLDAAFNANGTGANAAVHTLALQPDGRVLVGGAVTDYNGSTAAPDYVLRLNTDGTLDAAFNPGGTGASGIVRAVAVQPDGKVVIGGIFTAYNGNAAAPDYALRLNADGSLDAGFNASGTGANGTVNALALQPDGRVLAGGTFTAYNANLAAPDRVLRLNADGSLDAYFNPGGAGASNTVLALALQPDGKVLIGGEFFSYNGSGAVPARLLRLYPDGSLDTAYNAFNAGSTGANGTVNALALQPDGRVLAGGTFTAYNGDPTAPDYVLRLNANGTRDAAFNPGGTGANAAVYTLAVRPDGRVLVGGTFTAYNGTLAAPDRVLRLNADGSPNDGNLTGLTYTWSTGATGPSTTVSQPGDYQVTATTATGTGYSNVVRLNASPAVAVALSPAGPLALAGGGSATLTATATVPGFNTAGSGFALGIVYAVALQPDGKVVVGGDFTAYNGNAAAPDYVLRLNADGSLDNTFNPGGTGASGIVRAVAVQPDGKVVIGGIFTAYNGNAAAPDRVLRLNANGSLDTGFSTGGTGPDNYVYALAVQPDGKVLVGGSYYNFNGAATAPRGVLRLNANGSLDASFNPGGSGADNIVWALALQPDGKVVIGGTFYAYNGNAAAPNCVLRLNADGSLDTYFNPGGAGSSNVVYALAVQPDGKVLAGGTFYAYNGDLAAPDCVMRLNADGLLDPGFNAGGTGANSYLLAVAVQPDGKVVLGGNFVGYNGDFAAPDYVLRLNADGTLDTGFNVGGTGVNNLVQTLAVQGDGRLVTGGLFNGYNGNPAAPDALLRLNAAGSLNDAAAALPGATFVIQPGATAGPARTVSTAGTYTATATDPATGCAYPSNAVVVTTALATAAGRGTGALRLFPNPTSSAATLTGAAPGAAVRVVDALGRAVLSAAADARGTAALRLPAGTAPGLYVVRAGADAQRLVVE